VNWTVLQTAVSDLEVVSQEEDGFIWKSTTAGRRSGFLTVATTRRNPARDTAVAVHPEDERYRH